MGSSGEVGGGGWGVAFERGGGEGEGGGGGMVMEERPPLPLDNSLPPNPTQTW